MIIQGNFYKLTISEIFCEIWRSGEITHLERWGLMSALLKGSLSREEMETINRLIHAVRRGWLRVVD
ncbi:hypothetical protein JJD41_13120 [Oxynema sp. CENA135]|jgi:hypothetical protein|uniref:Uncharacterized protein n=1 Tax=Oxynema aestuarii AP17 TaxID=2064643 RepID=A0A6H1TUH7_9CYAN|nr:MULTISPECIES: hypothetical protein [Oxynema]MBK4730798.1 hypothetical protein [Oxynema sp. CENA135]QIZ69600.1 hypothetical protein HCG48_02525 [Oxynema aestuarii AP17]RMH74780.1 MAG: hypothetical protein D6680_13625 [Cyanobacteria bacterium J007]